MVLHAPITSTPITKIKRRNLLAISLTRVLHGFGLDIFNVVYQPFLLELTNSLLITGIIVSIGSVMQFLPMPLIGKISDKYHRKILITASMPITIIGITFFIISNPSAIYYAIIGIMIYFLGFTLNNLNSQFAIAENTDKSKGFIYGIMFFAFFGGRLTGSSFLIIASWIETRMYFLIFICILAIEGLIFGFLLSNKNQMASRNSLTFYNNSEKKENLWLKVIKTKTLRSILIFFTLDIFVYGLSLTIYNAGLRDYYQLTKGDLALLSISFNLTNMIFQIPAGRITDKLGNKTTLILSQIFGLGFFLMNIIAFSLWSTAIYLWLIPILIIGMASLALSVCTFVPAEQVILTNLGENRKAESYGIISFARGIGYIPTGYIGGFLVENLNYVAPFIFSTIGVFVEILFLLRFFHHHPQT
ncbi:MAG: MFS transporter [Candidatus Lokiarchaeota archaeon]|nr:MFS transporter [Candidatus Lokiarchaeota archaeon]